MGNDIAHTATETKNLGPEVRHYRNIYFTKMTLLNGFLFFFGFLFCLLIRLFIYLLCLFHLHSFILLNLSFIY